MAGTSLLALIDDIATLLDDVALYSKLAAKKTAGVLGDDLALNAEQVTGIKPDRELPVVWAVAKGAFLNKLILVPLALIISAFIPWLVILLLIIGGAYLCYEGFEKVFHKLFDTAEAKQQHHQAQMAAVKNREINLVEFEKNKIKGAIRTDFILSAEIVVLTLGTVKDAEFMTQVGVLSAVAIAVTIVVYGLVAIIVKIDDAGLYLIQNNEISLVSKLQQSTGRFLLILAPYLMKLLSVVGTAAMFLVGGGIIVHNIPLLHHVTDLFAMNESVIPGFDALFNNVMPVLYNLLIGVVVGGVLVLIGGLVLKFRKA